MPFSFLLQYCLKIRSGWAGVFLHIDLPHLVQAPLIWHAYQGAHDGHYLIMGIYHSLILGKDRK